MAKIKSKDICNWVSKALQDDPVEYEPYDDKKGTLIVDMDKSSQQLPLIVLELMRKNFNLDSIVIRAQTYGIYLNIEHPEGIEYEEDERQ